MMRQGGRFGGRARAMAREAMERLAALEAEVAALKAEVERLKQEMERRRQGDR